MNNTTPATYVQALLIGGPHDGQRVNVMDGQPVLAMPSPVAIDPFPSMPPAEPTLNVEHYHRSGFGMQHNLALTLAFWPYFVWDDWRRGNLLKPGRWSDDKE